MTRDPGAVLIVQNEPYSGHPNVPPDALIEPRVGQAIELRPGMNQIGRRECPENTIRIADASLARWHARIWYQEGAWLLDPLAGAATTEVNGQCVGPRYAGEPVKLKDGDRIRIGVYELWFRLRLPERAWLTPAVLGLARCISTDREFHLLPILADALEEAGCGDEAILQHCRQRRQGWRISWVVELLCAQQASAELSASADRPRDKRL
jgi:hypothetical protein